ncbi:DUF5050 domain-containing protein [Clostridium sp. MB40-C1]|uniref:DUF5050 domain-containing protein n=1 Tax=Clostridium sp. MB40-C1 TaxID=3070996 RepID=UPI0027E158D3|nr:DUF5050 domain-containing protein [Clostridium sp. MB40-C1]WMJ81769.1 DUF5050 domain-containing protein [Clostridium sp. MB40-C1]
MESLNKASVTVNNLHNIISTYDKVNINVYIQTGEYIYYIDASQDCKLYRIFKYDEKKELIVDYKVENIVIVKDNIFYTIKHQKKITLIKCNLEGKDTYIVCKDLSSPTSYCIHNKTIYYCENHNFRSYIKSVALDGRNNSIMHESVGYISNLYYFNSHIYYKRKDYPYRGSEVLKKININDKMKDAVVAAFYSEVYFYKNYMIYKNKNSSSVIIKNLETGKKIYETNQCNNILGVFNNYMLFTYEGFTDIDAKYVKNMLYMLNVETFNVNKLTDCNVSKAQMIDDYVYYKIKEKDSKIHRQNIDGEDKKTINASNKYFPIKVFSKLF